MSSLKVNTVFSKRILVVEPDHESDNSLYSKLCASGAEHLELLNSIKNLAARLTIIKADVLALSLEKIDQAVLSELISIKQNAALPVVIFASEYLPEMTKTVMSAGVSSYIVDDVACERIPVILDLAMERFTHIASLNKELVQAQQKLTDRKLVERAKGIIMQQKKISEDQAYKEIRTSAMNKGKTISDLSKQIISVYELMA